LRGKPDYLLPTRIDGHERLVPVEVKPSRRSRRLYDSDRMQLGAYLLALRATAREEAATFGVVRYATESFHVELTAELEADVRSIVLAIRTGRALSRMHRSHHSVARCRSCAVRHACDEALAR
jgi:CRISPR/Cas system-associated exonuclease Cas4 (RecB family)